MYLAAKQKLIRLGCLASVMGYSVVGVAFPCQSETSSYPVGDQGRLYETTYYSGDVYHTCRVYENEVQQLRSLELNSPKHLDTKKSISIDLTTLNDIRTDIEMAAQAGVYGFTSFNVSHETFVFSPSGKAVLLQGHRIGGCEERNRSPRSEALISKLAAYCQP